MKIYHPEDSFHHPFKKIADFKNQNYHYQISKREYQQIYAKQRLFTKFKSLNLQL